MNDKELKEFEHRLSNKNLEITIADADSVLRDVALHLSGADAHKLAQIRAVVNPFMRIIKGIHKNSAPHSFRELKKMDYSHYRMIVDTLYNLHKKFGYYPM